MSKSASPAKARESIGAAGTASRSQSLSTREAAEKLGLSERSVRRAIQRGALVATKRGGRYRIASDELKHYLHRHEPVRPASARPRLLLVPKPDEPPPVIPFPGVHQSPASLPAPLTRFVGREAEMAAVAALLQREEVRLLTMTGPGGAGKTRLALAVAARLASDFPDGASFVPLAPVRDPNLVAATIALVLDVRGGEEQAPLERLRLFLRDRRMLLLLDNFEQVLAAGPMLAELLTGSPWVTILVTSRAALRLSGERVFAVPPLALPKRGGADRHEQPLPPLSELAETEAVRLFVDRAEIAAGTFELTADNAAAVVRICERADGLPLAIELAAARTALLSPQALLERLDPRLPLLADGPRDQPDRLRTMHDAIAWSHDLLSPEERACFRRLGVFVGGCTMAGAEWVSGAGDRVSEFSTSDRPPNTRHPAPDTLELVQRLVDQAVLERHIDGAGEPRFTMLETIREYGLERLAESGEEVAVRDSHAAWCVAFAERVEPELSGPDQGSWVRRLEAELGNIRAAHDWLAARGDAESALRLAGAIGWFWSSTPYLEEARARFDALLAMPGIERFPAALAKVLNSAGDVADWQGDQTRARAHFERALGIYRELGDRWRMAGMLRGLGSSAIDRGELDLALALLEESLDLARQVGNDWELAAAANLKGTALSVRGEYAAAMGEHEAAVRTWRALGDGGHVTTALASAAWVALRAQEWRRAAEAYRETLGLAAAGGDEWYVTWAVIGGGGLAAARGDAKLAAELLGAGLAHRERLGALLRPHVQEAVDETIASVREQLGERGFAARWHAGRGLPLDVASQQAAAVLDAILQERPDPYGLTRRERDVLRLLAEGLADKEIAAALFVARATASKHVAAILEKLGVDSRTAAVAVALRHNLV